MGDSRRFDLFAKLIKNNFHPNEYKNIADVAGGKGHLQCALREHGYNVTTFDKRKRRNRSKKVQYTYRYFNSNIKEDFDLIVGMHPDEATDVIITEAAKRNIPFVICPCCVKPYSTVMWEQHNFTNWVKHLERYAKKLGYGITYSRLKMSGKNLCMVGL